MLGKYEAVIVFDPDLKEVDGELKKIEDLIKAHAGSVEKVDTWGRRQLAFRVAKKEFGIYVLMIFDGDRTLVSELDRALRISESVIRHLVVTKDKYAPDFSGVYSDDGTAADELPFLDEAEAVFDEPGKGETESGRV